MTPANELDATTTAEKVRSGMLKVADVVAALFARLDARDDDVRAFAYLDRDLVMAEAARLDALETKGPLHGVAIGVKDVILTKDMPTQHNTARYQGSRPGIDAACVDTLRSAGALILGKTVTTEFASTNRGGKTRNPLDLARTPGGSSSGSAAAVADFQAALGLGTQTGGSTIRPASFCGIFGWKPTWNSISREGLKMYSASCDTLGLYARSAQDFSLLADIFDLDPLESPAPATLEGARIGICRSPVWSKAEAGTREALQEGMRRLRQAGAETIDIDLPTLFGRIHDAHRKILRREGRSAFLNEVRATPGIHQEYLAIVGTHDYSAQDIREAYRVADQCRALFDDLAQEYDIILTPSVTGEAPLGQELTGDASFNSMWTILQVPVVNVPGLLGPAGLPIGLSFTARRYQDRKVIAYADLAAKCFAAKEAAMVN